MKVTSARIRQIIKEEISRALNESTLEQALRDSQKNDNPVIRISSNQYMQVRSIVRYKGNQPVITGYAVDFGTRATKDGISGSGMMASADGANGASKAIDIALEKVQKQAEEGKGPYGTDPIDMNAEVTILK